MFYYDIFAKRAENIRNGTRAIKAIAIFTNQSAMANDTQSGASDPTSNKGTLSHAHEISSFAAAGKNVMLAEKAMVKKMAVSRADPITVDANGARHHAPLRKRSKMVTSIICAIKNAVPDPTATRKATAAYS